MDYYDWLLGKPAQCGAGLLFARKPLVSLSLIPSLKNMFISSRTRTKAAGCNNCRTEATEATVETESDVPAKKPSGKGKGPTAIEDAGK